MSSSPGLNHHHRWFVSSLPSSALACHILLIHDNSYIRRTNLKQCENRSVETWGLQASYSCVCHCCYAVLRDLTALTLLSAVFRSESRNWNAKTSYSYLNFPQRLVSNTNTLTAPLYILLKIDLELKEFRDWIRNWLNEKMIASCKKSPWLPSDLE